MLCFFFFNDTATTEIYTLSLHDALPILACVTEKIHEFSSILRSAPLRERNDALKFLVHFVGDVHQPLHLGNLKDRGGGTLRFLYKGEVATLHYLWDGGLIDWGGTSLLKYAARLNGRVSEAEDSTWSLSTVSDWANESRSLALKVAYNVDKIGRASCRERV